jgi:hypothetical protein
MICDSAAAGPTSVVRDVAIGGLGSQDDLREETADQRLSLAVVMAETRLLGIEVLSSSLICEAR